MNKHEELKHEGPKRLLKVEDVATMIGVTPRTIMRWVDDEAFAEPVRLGLRILRWREEDIDAWIDERLRSQ